MTYHENLDRLERDDPGWYGVETPSREADPLHYHWGQNIPGYMPMSDDANFASDFDTARDALLEDMRHVLDSYDMGDDVQNLEMARSVLAARAEVRGWEEPGTVYAASDQPHDLGLAFWIASCAEDECWDDSDIGRANLASATILLGIAATGIAAAAPVIEWAATVLGGAA